jgi:plastocyanin
MNRSWLLPVSCILIFAVSLICLADREEAEASDITVNMKSLSFDPKVVEVHVGDSVMWTNSSFTKHTATSDEGIFDTGEINPNESSKPVKFEKEGEFKYHCKMHGKTMSGTVVVKPAGSKN